MPHAQPNLQLAARRTLRTLAGVALSCVLGVALISAHAAEPKVKVIDRALYAGQSNRIVLLPPGKAATVWFDFQNVGTSSWTNADMHPVSINTDDPMRRTSVFQIKQWRAFWRPSRVLQKTVKPGETGRFRFGIKAPKKTGIYRERFAMVRDRDFRITGGDAEFIIVVGTKVDIDAIYKAKAARSSLSYWVKPGERVVAPVDFTNTGWATWRNDGYNPVTLIRTGVENVISATSVSNGPQPTFSLLTARTGQKKSTSAIIDTTAPAVLGTYRETYALSGPFGAIAGSTLTVTMTVSDQEKPLLDTEPIVRVGIYAPVKPVVITSNGPHEIRNATTNEVVAAMAPNTESTTTYDPATARYTIVLPDKTLAIDAPLRFVPTAPESIMEAKSFISKRTVTVNGVATTINDNKFRGTLEVRYAAATGKLWVIDELLLEHYLYGLAETTSRASVEFVKTLTTAARSYALFHRFYGKKHANESYHINSTTDQVYRGYHYELRTPNITEGVNQTRGMVVTHPSMVDEKNIVGVIVAAYSSCTDGRTRSYEERWGGAPGLYPYLLSVPDPNGICTDPVFLKGEGGNHMVGMSALGAVRGADQQGMSFDTVLKYYYTGTSVIKAYL